MEDYEKNVDMQQLSRKNEELERRLDDFGLDALPDDVKKGEKAIGTSELKLLYSKFCGNSKDDESDDSLKSDIDDMDSEQLAHKSAQFRKNLENVEKLKDNSKMIDQILALNRKKKKHTSVRSPLPTPDVFRIVTPDRKRTTKERSQEKALEIEEITPTTRVIDDKKVVRIVKPNIKDAKSREKEVTEVSKRMRTVEIDIDKLPPMKRNKSDGTLNSWIGKSPDENQIDRNVNVQVFDTKKEENKNEKYLRIAEFSKILQVLIELTEKYSTKENQKKPIVHTDVLNKITPKDLESALIKRGIEMSFWSPIESKPKYILRKVKQLFKNEVVDQILADKEYGFRMKTKDCLAAFRRCYIMNRPEFDNGKSIQYLKISSHDLIVACDSTKKQIDSDYKPNLLVDRYLLSTKRSR